MQPKSFLTALLITLFFFPYQSVAQKTPDSDNKTKAFELAQRAEDLRKNGKIVESIDLYTKSIELDSKSFIAYFGRSLAFKDNREWEKVVKDLTKAIELKPDGTVFYYNRAEAYFMLDKYEPSNADLSIISAE
jgi:tetratricopeptide (TPR) repeat protein